MWFREAAERGDIESQFRLGCCYDKGEGVYKDFAEAVKWFRLAADRGHADAQFNLGICLAKGEGVPENADKAIEWLRAAAAQGHSSAREVLRKAGRQVPAPDPKAPS